MRVLLVKMSSLGDVVHALPGLTDAVDALGAGAVSFDWVVEEAFAAIPAMHPAVAEVVPIAWRRWRRDPGNSAGEMRSFLRRLRRTRYDLILDAQGLIKSAAVTALARGAASAGLARGSAREGAASFFYRRPIAVPRGRHAVDRVRDLFAAALGYPRPAAAPDYGIASASRGNATGGRRCLLLHGTTWESKHWPVRFWRALAERALSAGYGVELPWGDEKELDRAREIAAGTPARVLERQPLAALIDSLSRADLVVGVDSGLSHLAAALEVPTVVIYGATSSALTGCQGLRVRNVQAAFPCSPCLARVCAYTGPAQTWQGAPVVPACYATVPPETVWQAAGVVTGSHDAHRLLHI